MDKERLNFIDIIFDSETAIKKFTPENPQLLNLLDELELKIEDAKNNGFSRKEWDALELVCHHARDEYNKNNIEQACFYFLIIGKEIQSLGSQSYDEKWDSYLDSIFAKKQKITNHNREAGLTKTNLHSKKNREIIISEARRRWKQDNKKEIRIGAMCKIIHKHLTANNSEIFLDEFPKKPESLKIIIRELAPDYAKIGGAPKT